LEEVMTFYTNLNEAEYKDALRRLVELIADVANRDDLKRLRARSIKGRASNKKRWTSPH
jgi:hypothetical protein